MMVYIPMIFRMFQLYSHYISPIIFPSMEVTIQVRKSTKHGPFSIAILVYQRVYSHSRPIQPHLEKNTSHDIPWFIIPINY